MEDDLKRKNRNRVAAYMRFSAVGIQMMAIILAGVFGGYKLDKALNMGFPVFTLTLSLASIAIAMYFLFKEVGGKPEKKN